MNENNRTLIPVLRDSKVECLRGRQLAKKIRGRLACKRDSEIATRHLGEKPGDWGHEANRKKSFIKKKLIKECHMLLRHQVK